MVYESLLFQTLNNYGFDNDSIEMVKEYLRTRQLPDSLNSGTKIKRFLAKWDKEWKVENNKLMYIPENLEVVPSDDRNKVLLGIYKDLSQGVAQGIEIFYKRIRNKYLNIRRSDVSSFLKSQKVYQITRPQITPSIIQFWQNLLTRDGV